MVGGLGVNGEATLMRISDELRSVAMNAKLYIRVVCLAPHIYFTSLRLLIELLL